MGVIMPHPIIDGLRERNPNLSFDESSISFLGGQQRRLKDFFYLSVEVLQESQEVLVEVSLRERHFGYTHRLKALLDAVQAELQDKGVTVGNDFLTVSLQVRLVCPATMTTEQQQEQAAFIDEVLARFNMGLISLQALVRRWSRETHDSKHQRRGLFREGAHFVCLGMFDEDIEQ